MCAQLVHIFTKMQMTIYLYILPQMVRSFDQVDPFSKNIFSSCKSWNQFFSNFTGWFDFITVGIIRVVDRVRPEKPFRGLGGNLKLDGS